MIFKEIYKGDVDELNPSPWLAEMIKTSKEKKIVKFSKKRIIVLAAAACMVIGAGVCAAGHITALVAWSNPYKENSDYKSVSEYIEKENLSAVIPEELSNGYRFKSSNVGGVKGVDDEGNILAKGEKFQVTYSKEGCKDITLYVDPLFEPEDHTAATEQRNIKGIAVYYNEDTYKFVPSDYELTDEDKANLEDPHYYITDGSDEITVMSEKSILFEKDGKSYVLMGWDNDMTAGEWFEIAREIIG